MSAIPDGTAASSWMQPALAEGLPRRPNGGDGGYTAYPSPRGPSQGWDPYEVWLSRIEHPRRRRASFQVA